MLRHCRSPCLPVKTKVDSCPHQTFLSWHLVSSLCSPERTPTSKIECYCEETDTWERVGKIPDRHDLSCVSLRLRNDYVAMIDEDDDSDAPHEDEDGSDSNEDVSDSSEDDDDSNEEADDSNEEDDDSNEGDDE